MRAILSVCLIFLCNNAFITSQVLTKFLIHSPPPPNVTERRASETSIGFFTQKLDHFDSNNTETWSQKFFVNTEFFNNASNNVAFLMVGGESEAPETWMTYGSWIADAKKYGAVLFQLEHRYYGESRPFSDLATENLNYLSSRQALADAAEFIKAMNVQYFLGSNVKWISYGGSYAGSLSAWLRLKYPDSVYGAVSSSGPVIAEFDYSGYFQVVIDDLKNVSEECIGNLKKGMAQVDDLLINPNSSDETITSIFNLCDPIEQYELDHVNVDYFYFHLVFNIGLTVQYNGLLGTTIDDLCDILNDESKGSEIYRVAEIAKDPICLSYNLSHDVVEFLKNTSNLSSSALSARYWLYQTCTEFGWYMTTNREDKIYGRGVSIDFYTKVCTELFGSDFNSTFISNQIEKTNDYYHGTDINATRIIFIQGSFDPWHAVGLLTANNADSPVIYIEGTSHCKDLYESSEDDTPQLAEARVEVSRLIGEWLGYN